MPEQLKIPLPHHRRVNRPAPKAKCPCCRQKLDTKRAILTVWQSWRDWLVTNWEWSARQLVLHQAHHPKVFTLSAHPDLLWALEADASADGLELEDHIAQILDGYLDGKSNKLLRRGKRLELAEQQISSPESSLESGYEPDSTKSQQSVTSKKQAAKHGVKPLSAQP